MKVVSARKNGTREGDTRGERERLPKRPLARPVFLKPKYFQAPVTQATSTKLTLVVVCLDHSNLGPYPLVNPVGIPRTLILLLLKIVLDGLAQVYKSLYSTAMCRWTGCGFWPPVLNKVYNCVWVCQQVISCTIDLTCQINKVCILGIFCRKQGQDFKPSATHLYPNIGRVMKVFLKY